MPLLHRGDFLDSMMGSATANVGGVLLIGAGLYQWSPAKDRCLAQCRSPVGYLSHEWREGASGAFVMGVRHGTYCLGCCWALMALLFVLGIMNPAWIAVLAAFVLMEKLVARGAWLSRASGVGLVAWGVVLLAT